MVEPRDTVEIVNVVASTATGEEKTSSKQRSKV
jgi:hypothetical protein